MAVLTPQRTGGVPEDPTDQVRWLWTALPSGLLNWGRFDVAAVSFDCDLFVLLIVTCHVSPFPAAPCRVEMYNAF